MAEEEGTPDPLVDAALVVVTLVDSLVYVAEVSVAVVALVEEELLYVHFPEQVHDQLRTILQLDPFMADPFKEGPLAIPLLVQVMDGMVGDTTDIVRTVLGTDMHHGIDMAHILELSGVG